RGSYLLKDHDPRNGTNHLEQRRAFFFVHRRSSNHYANTRNQEKIPLTHRQLLTCAILFLLFAASPTIAQEKLLTIDDIFDPAKRVNYNGTPANPRWLKDGVHYMVVNNDRNASPRVLNVNAVTGKSQPLYDEARMEDAVASLT